MTISFAYSLHHPPTDPDAIRAITEALRQRAVALGLQGVGGVVLLEGNLEILCHDFGLRFVVEDVPITPIIPEIVCYFTISEIDECEIGLSRYPQQVELDGLSIPWGTTDWHWTGVIRTRDLETYRNLFQFAAESGLEASMSFANKTVVYSRDSDGHVKITEEFGC